MTKDKKKSFFTQEGYHRLAQNPFVDKKMLQFIKDKTYHSAPNSQNHSSLSKEPRDRMNPRTSGNRQERPVSAPIISDEAAKLIAAAIKGLLRD